MSPYLLPLKRVLILTADSVSSTYFQRLSTLYLNAHGYETVNFHELINHFDDSFSRLLIKLTSRQTSIVARLSQYRLVEVNEPHHYFLKACNMFFQNKFCVRRCSFETALSLAIRQHFEHPLNVYDNKQFKYIKEKTNKESISLDTFAKQLFRLENHYSWVDTNFSNVVYIDHSDLIFNTDQVLNMIFGFTKNLPFSFQEMNKNVFNIDRHGASPGLNYQKFDELKEELENKYPDYPFTFPRKKFTLSEKIDVVSNFDELLDFYNNQNSNHFEKISRTELKLMCRREDDYFGLS